MRIFRRAVLFVLAAAMVSAACAGRGGAAAAEPWDLQGVIAAVEADGAGVRLRVELAPGGTGDSDDVGEATLRVPPGTPTTVEDAEGAVRPGGAADLRAGARFRARHTGVELRSLPPQYVATAVQVIAPP